MTARDVAPRLPDIPTLRGLCRSMAMVEAILKPDSPYRRHGFDTRWSATQELAWMDNGGGDEYSVVFSAHGVYIRGFDHESPMSPYAGDGAVWPRVLDAVPEVFRDCVEEPSFRLDGISQVTACLWRETGDDRWQTGDVDFDGADEVPDGASWLFEFLTDRTAETYRGWAQTYYGVPVDLDAVLDVYELRPLTPEIVTALNPGVTLRELRESVSAIGYPTEDAGRSA